jgi:hypothetical protein
MRKIIFLRRIKMYRIQRKHLILSLILSIALIAAMALLFVSCDKEQPPVPEAPSTQEAPQEQGGDQQGGGQPGEQIEEVGQGSTSFSFFAKFADGSTRKFTVKTDKATVGEALVDAGLITGSESSYGLMVETVCGVKYDYTEDGMYWAFYVNGEYAMTGVDSTPISADETYAFKATRA